MKKPPWEPRPHLSSTKDITASVVPLSTGTSPARVPPHEFILKSEAAAAAKGRLLRGTVLRPSVLSSNMISYSMNSYNNTGYHILAINITEIAAKGRAYSPTPPHPPLPSRVTSSGTILHYAIRYYNITSYYRL